MVILAHATTPPAIENAWLIPLFPLAGAVVLLFFGKKLRPAAGAIATLMMTASFVTGVIAFTQLIQRSENDRVFDERLFSWIPVSNLQVDVGWRIDPLAIVMILVITGVGALIHLYSVGYMRGDAREGRYFAYLNLFAFSMLVLVMGNNFLQLYVGWELVGLCSYLLIGFWFEQRENANAAKKAFITNRVGDVAFMIGLFVIFFNFGTFDFDRVFAGAPIVSQGTATTIALLLLGGAVAKSAQIPLHVWLPDAMAGPTPVSALIHAATMVTAGVYLIARSHAFFDLSSVAGNIVAAIGVATALMAGLIAITQDDIKRVLAYSTVSQLGYMFVGVGVGAYSAGVFHLVTHSFFKALLFLGAGSVMHAMANRTDIAKMGGLLRKIPWTAVTFAAGWLAIIGFPGTSGFFSKDQILEGAFESKNYVVWGLAVFGVVLTGFYMTRLFTLTFLGKSRDEEGLHPHESPPSMVFPLVVLAGASIVGGAILGPSAGTGRLEQFLIPSVGGSAELAAGGPLVAPPEAALTTGQLSWIALAAGLLGAVLAMVMYLGRRWDWQARREHPGLLWRTARNKFYVDEAYQFVFTSAGKLVATTLAYVVDARVIDGIVNNVGTLATKVAATGRKLQSGMVRTYALGVLAGAVVIVGFLVGRTI